jgi:hypothetical protein
MQTLKRIFPSITKRIQNRRFAQVYDVKFIKIGEKPKDNEKLFPFNFEPSFGEEGNENEETKKGEMMQRNGKICRL